MEFNIAMENIARLVRWFAVFTKEGYFLGGIMCFFRFGYFFGFLFPCFSALCFSLLPCLPAFLFLLNQA